VAIPCLAPPRLWIIYLVEAFFIFIPIVNLVFAIVFEHLHNRSQVLCSVGTHEFGHIRNCPRHNRMNAIVKCGDIAPVCKKAG